jgi:repressor LexA
MITKKQHEVLTFIGSYADTHGYAPTYSEIGDAMGIVSKGAVSKHIQALERDGFVAKRAQCRRTLEVLKQPKLVSASNDEHSFESEGVPFVGKIAAGQPIMAIENVEYIDLNTHLNVSGKCFLLEVKGESMMDVGIYEGDWVLIKPSQTARRNEIVVALVDGQDATLKRYHQELDGTVVLTPENSHMPPMRFAPNRVQIQGTLVAQIRKY